MLAVDPYPARVTNVSSPGCLFCGIVAGEVAAEVVHQGARTLAFRDINPAAPVHVLVIPRDHHPNVTALADADPGLAADVMVAAAEVAAHEGVAESGYRVVLNTGGDGGQTVGHVHAHVLGGRPLTWPPG